MVLDLIVTFYRIICLLMVAGFSAVFVEKIGIEVYIMAGSLILLFMIVFSFCVSVTVVINKFRRR